MPKTRRNGQASSISTWQLDCLIADLEPMYKTIFSVCRFTACRKSESLGLRWENVTNDTVVIPRGITKCKKTREIPLNDRLERMLGEWKTQWVELFGRESTPKDFLFPDRRAISDKHVMRRDCDRALRISCKKLNYEGVSTHSFRRSALTAASRAGVSMKILQTLSGHSSMASLQLYIDTNEADRIKATQLFG